MFKAQTFQGNAWLDLTPNFTSLAVASRNFNKGFSLGRKVRIVSDNGVVIKTGWKGSSK